jgi:threonine dehydrogenase-like Zn-dependent dehydrogenase
VAARGCVWKLPDGVDPPAFSGLVLTQVGYNAGSRAPLRKGQHAVVIGDGLVGQWAAQTLAQRGANVTMLGTEPERLALAAQLTGCRTINVTAGDWADAVRAAAPRGVAVAADCAGSAEATTTMTGLMRPRGHIVSAGFCGTDDQVSLQALRDYELSIDSVAGWSGPRMQRTIEWIARGALQTLPLVTHHFPVARAAEAWDTIRAREIHSLGVILDWQDRSPQWTKGA